MLLNPLCLIGAFTVAELPLSPEAVAAQADRQAATTAKQCRLDPHYGYLVITGVEKSAYAFLEGIAPWRAAGGGYSGREADRAQL
jgi:hypothetical protein